MTAPQQDQVPVFDAGNALLCETPAQLTTMIMDTPAGQRLAMTVRTPSATVTVILQGADAKVWALQLSGEAAKMSGAGLAVASGAAAKR